MLSRWFSCGVFALVVVLASPRAAFAQGAECRHTCRADESRDGAGCCVAAVSAPAAPRSLPPRCPAGTQWSDVARACMGRLACPAGAHPEAGACVADVVGCPPGAHSLGDACVADVSCPPGSRREAGACVSEVACPAGAHLEGGRCVSSDVACPAGTRRASAGALCEGVPECPAGARFVLGRGCVGELTCAAGTHVAGDRCAPDATACAEGTRAEPGRGCVDACAAFAHARWEGTRHGCVCAPGFRVRDGACAAVPTCAAGAHLVGETCAPDVDPARAAHEAILAEEARREEEAHRAAHWAEGPALQVWAAGGGAYMGFPGIFSQTVVAPGSTRTMGARWLHAALSAGVNLSIGNFFFGPTYFHVFTSEQRADGWRVTPYAYDLLGGELGAQFVSGLHAARIAIGGGWDLGGNGAAGTVAYRSLFRIIFGAFVGLEARGIVMGRFGGFGGSRCVELPLNGCSDVGVRDGDASFGFGADLMVLAGYSLY